MKKCFVTGASGFIGAHLVHSLLERGDAVTCLVRPGSTLRGLADLPLRMARGDVRIAAGDVTIPDSLTSAIVDCDVVYHLAGLTKALTFDDMMRVNAGGVENVMQAAAALPTPPVVVLVSSLAAAGPAVDGHPREPSEPPHPVSNYGKSKLAGEMAARKYADRVPLTILRPPIVIGEGDILSLELFHTVSTFRVHLVPGWEENRLSIVHVTDLVRAMILAAERGERVPGSTDENNGQGIYYPADPEAPTFAEFGQLIARGLGRKHVRIMHTPHAAAWVLGGGVKCFHRQLSRGIPISIPLWLVAARWRLRFFLPLGPLRFAGST